MPEKIVNLGKIPMKMYLSRACTLMLSFTLVCSGCTAGSRGLDQYKRIIPGAERTGDYIPALRGKNVGIVANQTSVIGETHLIDSLSSLGTGLIRIWKVFSPEHGFRGEAADGELVQDVIDKRTGLPVISLYGANRKPGAGDLGEIDLMIFDIQDVGARFYTYISTLFYVMQACAENNVPLILLDRPNPNGFYVDGPVLDTSFSSFIGMHPVPVVYGMTIGEYGRMINGEGWLGKGMHCELEVIPCLNYDHSSIYELPVIPSPNLHNMNSIHLYPSTCFFEGTVISEGRGTAFPFEVFGHPDLGNADFVFTPVTIPGKSTHPKQEGEECRGVDLRHFRERPAAEKKLSLEWLLFAYENYPDSEDFFTPYFELLAGTDKLRKQIESGMKESGIRASWQVQLEAFKKVRQKYLIYPDFE